jgi:hypothetical protein
MNLHPNTAHHYVNIRGNASTEPNDDWEFATR